MGEHRLHRNAFLVVIVAALASSSPVAQAAPSANDEIAARPADADVGQAEAAAAERERANTEMDRRAQRLVSMMNPTAREAAGPVNPDDRIRVPDHLKRLKPLTPAQLEELDTQLPVKDPSRSVVRYIHRYLAKGGKIDEAFVRSASELSHEQWLVSNPSPATPEPKAPFANLSREAAQAEVDQVVKALDLYRNQAGASDPLADAVLSFEGIKSVGQGAPTYSGAVATYSAPGSEKAAAKTARELGPTAVAAWAGSVE